MHWSWTRFPFGRPQPRVRGWAPAWGQPDGITCPSYAQKWCSRKTYIQTPHGRPMGVDFFRSQFEQMTPDRHVCWRPYDERVEVDDDDAIPHSFLHDLPHICLQQRQFWFAQVTLALLLYSHFASLLFITYVGLFIFMYLQVPLVFYQMV